MKKKVILILVIILIICSYTQADARLGGHSRGGGGTHHTSLDSNGYPSSSCNHFFTSSVEGQGQSTPVGVVVTFLEYNTTSLSELGKFFFYNDFGSDTFVYQCASYGQYVNWVPQSGDVGCGGFTHDSTNGIEIHTYTVGYDSPSYSGELGSIPASHIYQLPDNLKLDFEDLTNSLEKDYGFLKMLLHMHDENYSDYNWANVLPAINQSLGLSLSSEKIENYYLKVEPVYRKYDGLKSSGTSSENNYGEHHYEEYDYGSGDADPSDEDGFGYDGGENGFGAYWNVTCYHTESRMSSAAGTSDDEDTCASHDATIGEDGTCSWDATYSYYNCCYQDPIMYYASNYSGLPSSLHTAREGGSYLSMLYNVADDNFMDAKDKNGTVIDGETDYFIGTNIENALVTEVLPGFGTSNVLSYTLKNNIHSVNSKYFFASSENDTSNRQNKTIGMAIYALIDLFECEDCNPKKCKDYCKSSSAAERSTDDYLSCAQNFCDSYTNEVVSGSDYLTNKKRLCITGSINDGYCGYIPGKPIDCKAGSPSVYNTSFKSLNPGVSSNASINGSYCGFESNVSTTRTEDSTSKTGGYADCTRLGHITPQTVNGVEVYAYGTSNTDNSYINAACKEYTSFDFKDLSSTVLEPGDGFDYYAKLYHGIRECILFFDYEQWKFDFASTHSSDKVRKTLLINKVRVFNELIKANGEDIFLNGSNIVSSVLGETALNESEAGMYDTTVKETIDLADGDIQPISTLEYSTAADKITVKSTVTEYVNRSPYLDGNKPYSKDNNEVIELDRISVEPTQEGNLLTKTEEDTLLLLNAYDMSRRLQLDHKGFMQVNRYSYLGTLDIEYQLPEVCLDDDNSGKVSAAPSNGICSSTRYGNSPAKRLYYTHYNATLTKDLNSGTNHYVKTSIEVRKTDFNGSTTGSAYLSGDDTCPYTVDKDTDKDDISCTIKVYRKADSGEAKYPDDDQSCYNAENVYITGYSNAEFKMTIKNETSNDVDIDSFKMTAYNSSDVQIATVTDNDTLSVPVSTMKFKDENGKTVTDSNIKVIGDVTIKKADGSTYTYRKLCRKEVILAKTSNGCTITKDTANNRYEIITSSSEKVYITTGNEQSMYENLVFMEVKPTDGHYYVGNLNPSGYEIVIAKVGEGTSVQYCQLKPDSCPPSNDCFQACAGKTGESRNICARNYCANEGLTDGYSYYPDCKTACSGTSTKHPCTYYINGKQCENFEYVKNWCNNTTNLAKTIHSDAKDCMQLCYCQEGTPTYRPINLNNPFPNSAYSTNHGYKAGNREVGAEWKIDMENDNTIEQDRVEVNKGATQPSPEYKVLLTPNTIAALNSDTDMQNADLQTTSIYTSTNNSMNTYDTASGKFYVCSKNNNNREYTGYCSTFIHESNFTSIFKFIDGRQANGVIGG